MSNVELALSYFDEGFSCSQALLTTFCPQLGLDQKLALKLATAFGGGMGRLGETCGVVTAAFMVIGLKHGKASIEDDQARENTYAMVLRFVTEFKSRHGAIRCKKLLGCDISTPEGMQTAREKQLITVYCPQFIQDAVEIVELIL